MRRGEEVYSKVPFCINREHPINDFHGRSYLPVTIAYSLPQKTQGVVVEDYLVLYLRLDDVPAPLHLSEKSNPANSTLDCLDAVAPMPS